MGGTSSEDAGVQLLEIRTYKLAAGARDEFDRIVHEGSLPMLERFGIRVVASGPSADDDDDHYYLIRAFSSAAERREQLDSFYGSEEWRQNYGDAVMGLIETYHTVVIELTPPVREALRIATSASRRARRATRKST